MKNLRFYLFSMFCMCILCVFGCNKSNKQASYKAESRNVTNKDSIYIYPLKATNKDQICNSYEDPKQLGHDTLIHRFQTFLRDGTETSYKKIDNWFMDEEDVSPFEVMIYAIVGADKYKLLASYKTLCGCFSFNERYCDIGDNSLTLTKYYYAKDTTHYHIHKNYPNYLRKIKDISHIIWINNIRGKKDKSKLYELKENILYGSINDYEKLKKVLCKNNQYECLLFYSYIMADRYHYNQAKKDIIYIVQKFYKDNNLGKLGEDAMFFCGFFK